MAIDRGQAGERRSGSSSRTFAPSALLVLTLAYLGTPLVIFLLGWTRWAVGLPAVAALAVAVWSLEKVGRIHARGVSGGAKSGDGGWTEILGAGSIVATMSVLGSGGFGWRGWDWSKHAAILRDLIDQPWPVAYEVGTSEVTLTYYVAGYLLPALAGRWLGWVAAHLVEFGLATFGVWLVWQWMRRLTAAPGVVALFVFWGFAGLDVLAAVFGLGRKTDLLWLQHWSPHWVFESNFTHLSFAPWQALAGWLLMAVVWQSRSRAGTSLPLLVPVTLGLLWSPFAVAGLLAFFVVESSLRWHGQLRVRGLRRTLLHLAGAARGQFSLANVCALPAFAVLVSFYLARWLPPVRLPEPFSVVSEGDRFQSLFLRFPLRQLTLDALWFALLSFGALAVVTYWAGSSPRWRRAVIAAAATLILVMAWRYGHFNDLAMRASIPALFVLQLAALRVLATWRRRVWRTVLLVLVLTLGALGPLLKLRLYAGEVVARRDLVAIPGRRALPDLFALQRGLEFDFVGQYLGSNEAFFSRVLARPTRPRTISAEPHAP